MSIQLSQSAGRWARVAVAAALTATVTMAGQPPAGTSARTIAASSTTFLGTPRNQTMIVDNIGGREGDPSEWNPMVNGTDTTELHSLNTSPLWEINTSTGQQFPDVASAPIKALNKNYTSFEISIRKGLYWSDGVELTANDVVWTINLLMHNPKLLGSSYLTALVKDATLVNQFTFHIDTLYPDAHFQRQLGSYIWGAGWYILPEHIWSKVNPLTYRNDSTVGMGPYVLKKYDPNGYWDLWELRSDWQRSDTGLITGKPGPKYVLVRDYGPEQNRVVAAIQHQLDVFMPLSPFGWSVLQQRDSYAKAWYQSFPYADFNDPAARGITFNDTTYPFNMWQVRWALALAINLPEATLSYDGMMRASALAFPSTDIAEKVIYDPLQSWLNNFKLPDGYKPYDPQYALELVNLLKQRGFQGLPTNVQQTKNLFGLGWWKYDPIEAQKLLKSVGFKRSSTGQWFLPNGQPWSITVNGPSNFEPEAVAIAGSVSNQWKSFGIDANVQSMDSSTYFTVLSTGAYQAGAYWPVGFLTPDSSDSLTQFDQKYIVPTGTTAAGNSIRWKSAAATQLVRAMQLNPPESPKTIQEELQFMKVWVPQMPMITMFDSSQLVPTDNYYWTGFPASTNSYNGPWWWWSVFKFILPYTHPTGRS